MADTQNFVNDDVILPSDFDPNNAADYDIFADTPSEGDFFTKGAAFETDATPAAETQTPTIAPQEPMQPTIKVKFNHEERELSYDEAATYAQKGMNYDKLEQRVRDYEALNQKMARLAKDLEYDSPDEMLDAAANNFKERQIRKLMEDGTTEAVARFIVEERMKATSAVSPERPAEAPSQQTTAPGLSPERKAELDEFIRAYPGVTKLPDEVIAANRNGVRLLVAYERHKNKAAQDELAILRQNQASAAKAPVTGVTGKAGATNTASDDDPFLKGFNS